MHWIDLTIFIIYMILMLLVGIYFLFKNKSQDDYYVGGRKLGSLHIGLSVVATDVGGGFSIGLGGLGFVMGISGSWMLATGLIGAWLAAVFLIPKISRLGRMNNLLTFPQIFRYFYGPSVAIIAGIISVIGYVGFTSSQLLAGAKLASSTFETLNTQTALLVMGGIAVLYTSLGGLKAVIYTDTIQWIILMAGLIFLGIPFAYNAIGGYEGITGSLSEEFLSLTNVKWQTIVNWAITIIPIWFVGMTLYQRIYACKSEKAAKRAWFMAGLFEYPVMAFMGVLLGLFARVAFENGMFSQYGYMPGSEIDSETGIPLLLKTVLPVGLMGLMMAAFFSAIMSTADSCLMAASGNIITDLFGKWTKGSTSIKSVIISQIVTLIVGVAAIIIAMHMESVLDLMLYSYAFMVSGLFIPVLGLLILKKGNPLSAIMAMIIGGGTTLALTITNAEMPFDLDANIFGILASVIGFIIGSMIPAKTRI